MKLTKKNLEAYLDKRIGILERQIGKIEDVMGDDDQDFRACENERDTKQLLVDELRTISTKFTCGD